MLNTRENLISCITWKTNILVRFSSTSLRLFNSMEKLHLHFVALEEGFGPDSFESAEWKSIFTEYTPFSMCCPKNLVLVRERSKWNGKNFFDLLIWKHSSNHLFLPRYGLWIYQLKHHQVSIITYFDFRTLAIRVVC